MGWDQRTGRLQPECKVEGLYQIVQFRVIAEEGFMFLLLLVDKVLDVHVKAGGGDALGALGGLFTFLKQQRQKREKRVPVGTLRAHTCAHRDQAAAGAPFPAVPSLLFPGSNSLRMSPVPKVCQGGNILFSGMESPLLGPPRVPTFPLWSDKLHGEVIALQRCWCPFQTQHNARKEMWELSREF